MKTTMISAYDALNALETVVAASGRDFVYEKSRSYDEGPACVYVRHGSPSCGVGRALATLGVPTSILADLDRFGDSSIAAVRPYLATRGYELTEGALEIFWDFQSAQDSGYSYGTCLDVVYRNRVERQAAAIRGTK